MGKEKPRESPITKQDDMKENFDVLVQKVT